MSVGFAINKHIAIAQTGVLYFLVASALSGLVCRLNHRVLRVRMGAQSTAYVLTQMALVGIVGYYSRKIVRTVPYVLDGAFGYDHGKLKELQGGVVIAYAIFAMQEGLADKVRGLPALRFVSGGACGEDAKDARPGSAIAPVAESR